MGQYECAFFWTKYIDIRLQNMYSYMYNYYNYQFLILIILYDFPITISSRCVGVFIYYFL